MDAADPAQAASESHRDEGAKDDADPKKTNIRKRTKTGCISELPSIRGIKAASPNVDDADIPQRVARDASNATSSIQSVETVSNRKGPARVMRRN